MAGRRVLDRLDVQDLSPLLWDELGWSGDIGALAVMDGSGLLDSDGRLPIDAVRESVESRLHLVPRLRQRLYRPRPGLGWPLWVDAPFFDLADHVRVHPLPSGADERHLLHACEQLYARRLDQTRPLWEMILLPGLPHGRVGLFLRIHHAMADGVSGVAAFGALLDLAAAAPTAGPSWMPTAAPSSAELLRDNLRRRRQEWGRGWSGLTRLGDAAHQARSTWPAWREFFAEKAPRTSLNRPVGVGLSGLRPVRSGDDPFGWRNRVMPGVEQPEVGAV